MKLRSSLLATLSIGLALAPVALGQIVITGPIDTSTPRIGPFRFPKPSIPGQQPPITNRVLVEGVLRTPGGEPIGKVRAGSGQRDTQVLQGLKVSATGLAPSTEYALLLDNALVGSGTSSATGSLRMAFLSPSNGRVPEVPQSVGIVTNARTATLVQVSTQQAVATADLAPGSVKPR